MRTSITGLRGGVFFLCLAFCVVADALACSSHLKCEIESESAVCYWVCFVRTEQCVCV